MGPKCPVPVVSPVERVRSVFHLKGGVCMLKTDELSI